MGLYMCTCICMCLGNGVSEGSHLCQGFEAEVFVKTCLRKTSST